MKTYQKFQFAAILFSMLFIYSCNNSGSQTTIKNEKAKQTVENQATNSITPIVEEGYFSSPTITDKGMLAYANVDYDNNQIKIALPVYTTEDEISIDTASGNSNFMIDIEVPENSSPFDATAYITIEVNNVSQYDNYIINIKNPTAFLYSKTIENESITESPSDYSYGSVEYQLEVVEAPQHFYDFFINDSLLTIFADDASYPMEILEFAHSENPIINADTNSNYLFIGFSDNGKKASPESELMMNFYTLNLPLEYKGKPKKKIKRSPRYRKTLSRNIKKK